MREFWSTMTHHGLDSTATVDGEASESAPKRGLRGKIGFALLLGGLGFLLVAWFSQPRVEGETNPLLMVAATLAGAGILTGLGVLVFGAIKFTSLHFTSLHSCRSICATDVPCFTSAFRS